MDDTPVVLALDQGTTSSRAIAFDETGTIVAEASEALPVTFPADGWVEQDGNDIWNSLFRSAQKVVSQVGPRIVNCGITNQRETILVWDRKTGEPLAPAIVWQCRRSEALLEPLRGTATEKLIKDATGLVLDPYFSAAKIQWLLRNNEKVRSAVTVGTAVIGTVDTYILSRLTAGKSFFTEPSNASRTMLYSLESGGWDDELFAVFDVPRSALPEIRPSSCEFGETDLFGFPIPVSAILGDQQASLFGHGCWDENQTKCTFGTGAFLLANSGGVRKTSRTGLLSTIAWDIPGCGFGRKYALEGSIFTAGSAVQWLRDGLQFLRTAEETERVGSTVPDSAGVVVVPALSGLGAPHWLSAARGTMFGLTRDTKPAHIVRATLEGICHQVADVLESPDLCGAVELCVDGGMSRNPFFIQVLADVIGLNICKPRHSESTAAGIAALAAISCRLTSPKEARAAFSRSSDTAEIARPKLSELQRASERQRWARAVRATRSFTQPILPGPATPETT